jgi:hypothetical protein
MVAIELKLLALLVAAIRLFLRPDYLLLLLLLLLLNWGLLMEVRLKADLLLFLKRAYFVSLGTFQTPTRGARLVTMISATTWTMRTSQLLLPQLPSPTASGAMHLCRSSKYPRMIMGNNSQLENPQQHE